MTTRLILTTLLSVPALTSAAYFLISAGCLRRWFAHDAQTVIDDGPPVTFFRPLKAGVPDLMMKLEVVARTMRTDDQLLLGVEPGSAEAGAAEALRGAFSQREIVVVSCALGAALNPKISKLVQMEPLARHEGWILSDSEAVLDAEFLDAFRREWTTCDVLTAGYRFAAVKSWPQRLDAAAVLLTLWPGLAVLRASGRARLTLGACTGFRRSDLRAVGGWAAFAEELAEDHRLGVALAAAGKVIRLSRSVVTLGSDPLSWRDYWRHQRRVAITYRMANPAGFAGAWLTQGVTTSFALACAQPWKAWTWGLFAGVFVIRGVTAKIAARRLAFPLPAFWTTVFLASLVETTCWVLSWRAREVWWGGVRWRLKR